MRITGQDTLKTKSTLVVDGKTYHYFSLPEAAKTIGDVSRLPMSLKVLLENVLRFEDGRSYSVKDAESIAGWLAEGRSTNEVPFKPSRILMQDFTGVPGVVDLAAMRDGIIALGGDPRKVNPLVPVDLVIDHSVMVDSAGSGQLRCRPMSRWNSSAMASATSSCAGARAPSPTSAWCRRAPASATRSIWNTWPRWSGPRPMPAMSMSIPTAATAPTATPPW